MYMYSVLIFLRKSDCLGCIVLLCLVCLTLFASFFLPSHLSLKHVHFMSVMFPVQALLEAQAELRGLVPGFTFNLGFVGGFYDRGLDVEVCVCVCVCVRACVTGFRDTM